VVLYTRLDYRRGRERGGGRALEWRIVLPRTVPMEFWVNNTGGGLDWIVVPLQGVRARIQVLSAAKGPNSDRMV
jgi:hypothetical protein